MDENKENVVETTPKKSNFLVVVSILLFLLVVCLGIYIFMMDKKIKELEKENKKQECIVQEDSTEEVVEIEDVKEDTGKEVVTKPQIKTFSGKYISAEVPENWSVKELFGKEGSSFVGDEYTGLSAVNIYKDGKEMLTLQTVRLGGGNPFTKIYRFKDYSPKYEEEMTKLITERGDKPEIIDYTKTVFYEYKVLGQKIRRIETTLFEDARKDTETFESIESLYIQLPINCGEESISLNYYKYIENISSQDLLVIDDILQSFKVSCR